MVFYFTATGNSKFIGEKISGKTGDSVIDIAACVRNGEYKFELSEGESLGFVVPVYFLGIPIIVTEFLKKLQVSGKPDYTYAVLNCGRSTGNAVKFFKTYLKLNAVYGIFAPGNYVPLYKMESNETLEKQLDKCEEDSAIIAEKVIRREQGTFNALKGPLPHTLTAFAYPMYKKGRRTKKFTVNSSCVHCGVCVKVCPRQAIKFESNKPAWTKPQCELCLACLHKCPAQAINYGKSVQRGRYHNTRVSY